MTNDLKNLFGECDCEKLSCKEKCSNYHTHKTFTCDKCKPSQHDIELVNHVLDLVEKDYNELDKNNPDKDNCNHAKIDFQALVNNLRVK